MHEPDFNLSDRDFQKRKKRNWAKVVGVPLLAYQAILASDLAK